MAVQWKWKEEAKSPAVSSISFHSFQMSPHLQNKICHRLLLFGPPCFSLSSELNECNLKHIYIYSDVQMCESTWEYVHLATKAVFLNFLILYTFLHHLFTRSAWNAAFATFRSELTHYSAEDEQHRKQWVNLGSSFWAISYWIQAHITTGNIPSIANILTSVYETFLLSSCVFPLFLWGQLPSGIRTNANQTWPSFSYLLCLLSSHRWRWSMLVRIIIRLNSCGCLKCVNKRKDMLLCHNWSNFHCSLNSRTQFDLFIAVFNI